MEADYPGLPFLGLKPIFGHLRVAASENGTHEEARARTVARAALRPRLRWLVDHPRLLGTYWRFFPRRRPELQSYMWRGASIYKIDGKVVSCDASIEAWIML